MVAWMVLIVGAVSAFLSIRHLMVRSKVEEGGDITVYRQGLTAWALEVVWLLASWLMVLVGLYLVFSLKAGQ